MNHDRGTPPLGLTVTLALLLCLGPATTTAGMSWAAPGPMAGERRGLAQQWMACLQAAARRLHQLAASRGAGRSIPAGPATSWTLPLAHRGAYMEPALPQWRNLPPPAWLG